MRFTTSLLSTLLALTALLPTTTADSYSFAIYQEHFCDTGMAPETYYYWEGDDTDCHELELANSNCRYYWNGGFNNGDCTGNGQPTTASSIFQDDGGGAGCNFWADQHCG